MTGMHAMYMSTSIIQMAMQAKGGIGTHAAQVTELSLRWLSELAVSNTPRLHLRPEHFDGTHGCPAAYRTDMQFVYGITASLVSANNLLRLADDACPTERSYGTARKKHAVQEPLQDALQMLHAHTCPCPFYLTSAVHFQDCSPSLSIFGEDLLSGHSFLWCRRWW